MAKDNQVLLDMQGIQKSFIGVNALKGVQLKVNKGEVHALEGENGAGKSVLIKILTGIYQRDGGRIIFDNREVDFQTPADAQNAGIQTIYQELNVAPLLSVTENLFMDKKLKKFGLLDWKRMNQEAEEILKTFEMDIDVTQPIGSFSVAIQQMIMIAKCVAANAKLIIMDEVTSSLADREVGLLFHIIEQLKSQGISIIFVTHRMDEIYAVCDRVTVLKDGDFIGAYALEELPRFELISKMVGRPATEIESYKKKYNESIDENELVCSLENVSDGKRLRQVSMVLRKGEVLGIAGLLGSGRTETANIVCGVSKVKKGELKVHSKTVSYHNIRQAMKNKTVICPEERKRDAIFPNMSIEENITISALDKISRFGIIDRKRQAQVADEMIRKLKIKTPNKEQKIKFLSGGNQQKCIVARALFSEPDIVIMDEPTRGIDVGAKLEIETLIQDIALEGKSVIMISSILEELERDCDRITVIRDGVVVDEIEYADISQDAIIYSMSEAEA